MIGDGIGSLASLAAWDIVSSMRSDDQELEPREEEGCGGYRDLRAWQCSMRLCRDVYRLTLSFPDEERYGLTSQMRRAAVSAPSNIAEGQGRLARKEFVHLPSIALGRASSRFTEWTPSGLV